MEESKTQDLLFDYIRSTKEKAIAVIDSCETQTHLKGAGRYVKLLILKWNVEVEEKIKAYSYRNRGEARKIYSKLLNSTENLLLIKLRVKRENTNVISMK